MGKTYADNIEKIKQAKAATAKFRAGIEAVAAKVRSISLGGRRNG